MATQNQSDTVLIRLTIAAMALVGVAVTFAWFMVKPELESKRKFEKQRDELILKVEKERREVQEINDKILRFESDPEFVEHEARKNHRIFPGETEFVFDAPE